MLLALTVMWGSAFLLIKVALVAATPELIVATRLLVAASVLGLAWLLLRRRWPQGRRLWLFFVLIALLGNTLPFGLITWGQQSVDSSLAGILMAVMPLFTLVIGHFSVPGEHLTTRRLIGFGVGFSGMFVLMAPGLDASTAGAPPLIAMLAILGGAACYAVSAVLSRLRPPSDALTTAAATLLLASLMALVLFPPAPEDLVALPGATTAVAAMLALGLFSTAVAALVYFRLITETGPAFVSQLNYLIPLWAVALGVLLLDERLAWSDLLAMLLVLAGIALSFGGHGAASLAWTRSRGKAAGDDCQSPAEP
jgi:drug/metabolite transporter (DMT)-like permease